MEIKIKDYKEIIKFLDNNKLYIVCTDLNQSWQEIIRPIYIHFNHNNPDVSISMFPDIHYIMGVELLEKIDMKKVNDLFDSFPNENQTYLINDFQHIDKLDESYIHNFIREIKKLTIDELNNKMIIIGPKHDVLFNELNEEGYVILNK